MRDYKQSLYTFFTKNLLFFLGGAVGSSLISQSLQDFFISCVAIGVFWHFFRVGKSSGNEILPDSFSVSLFIGWFVVAVLGIVLNYGIHGEYLNPLLKFKWILLFYCFAYIVRYFEYSIESILSHLLFWVALPSLYCWATFFSKTEFLYPDRGVHRVVGLINSSTYHAHAGGVIFAFLGGLYIYFFKQFSVPRKILYLSLGFLLVGSIYLTYTRGIYGALAIGFLLGFLLWRPIWSLYGAALMGILLAVLVNIDPTMADRVSVTFDKSKFDMGRVALLESHIQMFKDHPILGMGFDVYKDYSKSESYSKLFGVPEHLQNSHAHNQYVQVLSMTGALGFLFFSGLCVYFLFINFLLLKNSKKGDLIFGLAFAALVAQIEVLVGFLTDQSFEYAKIRVVILALWAFVYALYFRSKESMEKR